MAWQGSKGKRMTKADNNSLYFQHSQDKLKALRHYLDNTLKLHTNLTDTSANAKNTKPRGSTGREVFFLWDQGECNSC